MGSQGSNGQANLRNAFFARKRMVAAAAWLAVLALVLCVATFAWFSGSRFTSVTPTAHTVSENGYDLLISASEQGPFAEQCQLGSVDKTLYPVSTADLSDFWRATFQNAAGITTDYANCTSELGEYALTGTFYLKGSSLPLAVYLYPSQMSISADSQLLAAARVGFIIQSSAGTQSYMFQGDDLGATSGAAPQRTTAQSDVVVSGQGSWSYVADPAQSISAYSMDGSGNTPTARSGAAPLFTLGADEVASVRYFVYMEGCDANCIGEAQSKSISLQFAFAGAKA